MNDFCTHYWLLICGMLSNSPVFHGMDNKILALNFGVKVKKKVPSDGHYPFKQLPSYRAQFALFITFHYANSKLWSIISP
jgi:hypothetical protein